MHTPKVRIYYAQTELVNAVMCVCFLRAEGLHRSAFHFFILKSTALESDCEISGVPERKMFDCISSNQLVSVKCSFDGGPGEACSFPLEVEINRFGTDNHTLLVTVVDVFGQSLSIPFRFRLAECESFKYRCVASRLP